MGRSGECVHFLHRDIGTEKNRNTTAIGLLFPLGCCLSAVTFCGQDLLARTCAEPVTKLLRKLANRAGRIS